MERFHQAPGPLWQRRYPVAANFSKLSPLVSPEIKKALQIIDLQSLLQDQSRPKHAITEPPNRGLE
jgi:hypothetical protein